MKKIIQIRKTFLVISFSSDLILPSYNLLVIIPPGDLTPSLIFPNFCSISVNA